MRVYPKENVIDAEFKRKFMADGRYLMSFGEFTNMVSNVCNVYPRTEVVEIKPEKKGIYGFMNRMFRPQDTPMKAYLPD